MQIETIPWGAWYEETQQELMFPDSWQVRSWPIHDAPRLIDQQISLAVKNSICSASLQELAKGRKNAVIAVEDITRPVKLERVLRHITEELVQGGLPRDVISFVICNGAHAPMLRDDMAKKYGNSILSNYLILNHNPYDNLIETDILLGKTPLRINRHFAEADLKIGVGTIMPHSFAGFSSGGKLVLPGLSDMGSLERSHKFVMMGLRGGVNDVETNKFRLELEDVAKRIGLEFFVGLVPNSKREIAGVFAGDLVDAHRSGVDFARQIFKTKILPSDILILNAYPKDTELIQADTSFTPLNTTKAKLVNENGVVIVTTSCSNGLGYHSLFGPGMRLYRKPIKRRLLGNCDLIVFAPNINKAEFKTIFWEDYMFADNWETVLLNLQQRFPGKASVSILPTAPLQLLEGE